MQDDTLKMFSYMQKLFSNQNSSIWEHFLLKLHFLKTTGLKNSCFITKKACELSKRGDWICIVKTWKWLMDLNILWFINLASYHKILFGLQVLGYEICMIKNRLKIVDLLFKSLPQKITKEIWSCDIWIYLNNFCMWAASISVLVHIHVFHPYMKMNS